MKTVFIILAIFFVLATSATAQKIKPSEMSAATVAAFQTKLDVLQRKDTINPFTSGLVYTKAQIDAKTAVTFAIRMEHSPITTVADATAYYWGSLQSAGTSTTTAATRQVVIPFDCTLVGYSLATRSTAAASNETHSLYVRVNNTTDITLSTAVTFAVGGANIVNYFSSNALNTNLSAGDKIEMKYVSATSATDPTSAYLSTILFFKSR